MKFVVTRRCEWNGAINKESQWTWTLYIDGPIPIARAEYAWGSPSSAQKDARKFRALMGKPDIPIHTTK